MKRLRPETTGIAVGIAIALFGALYDARRPLPVAIRWIAAGSGLALLATHMLQRLDESASSRHRHRRTKLKILAKQFQPSQSRSNPTPPQAASTFQAFHENDLEPATLFQEEPFSHQNFFAPSVPSTEAFQSQSSQTFGNLAADLKTAFDTAMTEQKWHAAVRAYQSSLDAEVLLNIDETLLSILRNGALQEIFQRMHSGTVREDVAILAEAIVDNFPDSKEGRTLGPVMAVLRRSAGLCPRCSLPYRGIANACHDCLRGTPEAFQIAWDEEISNQSQA